MDNANVDAPEKHCDGSSSCVALLHEHGCYSDTGNCNFPREHWKYETVECVQAVLDGHGCILYPGTPEDPPKFITRKDIEDGEYRIFDTPNMNGPLILYKYEGDRDYWTYAGTSMKTDRQDQFYGRVLVSDEPKIIDASGPVWEDVDGKPGRLIHPGPH